MKIKNCSHTNDFLTCDTTGMFEGYASVFNVIDSHDDVVLRGAFSNSLKKWKQKNELPKMLWQHDPEHVIGVWHSMEEDAHGLYVKGQLLLDVSLAREAYALLKAKALNSMSIGYTIQKIKNGVENGKSVKFLEDISLWEVSLVTFASNELAKIEYVKSAIYHIADQKELRSFCTYMEQLCR